MLSLYYTNKEINTLKIRDMTIQEKINGEGTKEGTTFYVAMADSSDARFIFSSSQELNEGDEISKENPIQISGLKTLCQLSNEVYENGVYNPNTFGMFSEAMKTQAIDFECGYITEEEIEYGLN